MALAFLVFSFLSPSTALHSASLHSRESETSAVCCLLPAHVRLSVSFSVGPSVIPTKWHSRPSIMPCHVLMSVYFVISIYTILKRVRTCISCTGEVLDLQCSYSHRTFSRFSLRVETNFSMWLICRLYYFLFSSVQFWYDLNFFQYCFLLFCFVLSLFIFMIFC